MQPTRRRPAGRSGSGRARRGRAGLLVLLTAVSASTGSAVAAQPPVSLGTASTYALLAGSSVTNTGPSVLNGDVGLTPGTAISGFPPGTINGVTHVADAEAGQAQSDLTAAYDDAAGRTPALAVSGDLGGLTLTPGVYKSGSSLGLTGTLTLDAQNDPSAVWVFQVGSSITTASGSRVALINGAQPCNVVWQVGSSATLGTGSTFVGNLLALTSISVNDAVTVRGRTLARNGAVTLINDTITPTSCAPPPAAPPSGDPAGQTPTGTSPATGGGTTTTTTTPSRPGRAGGPASGGAQGPGSTSNPGATGNGAAIFTTTPRAVARRIARDGVTRCVDDGFRVTVTGLYIRRVVFSVGGTPLATRTRSPWTTIVRARRGIHRVTARVTFTDGTAPKTLSLRFRACATSRASLRRAPSRRPRTPGGFTG